MLFPSGLCLFHMLPAGFICTPGYKLLAPVCRGVTIPFSVLCIVCIPWVCFLTVQILVIRFFYVPHFILQYADELVHCTCIHAVHWAAEAIDLVCSTHFVKRTLVCMFSNASSIPLSCGSRCIPFSVGKPEGLFLVIHINYHRCPHMAYTAQGSVIKVNNVPPLWDSKPSGLLDKIGFTCGSILAVIPA